MILFFKYKEDKQAEADIAATKIAAKINAVLHVFAAYLQESANKLSHKAKVMLLVIFIISSASLIVYQIRFSLLNSDGTFLSITPVSKPAYSTKTGEENVRSKLMASGNEYKSITDLKNFFDSVNTAIKGKKARDNILLKRPGLIDSLRRLEKYLIKQQKEMLWKRKRGY